ncbi:A/G-specific adenine glycosylase [Tepidiforma sp.]|jgi:A/G-specific adenine glycosylase|uniref:A/G-specific adenine glycosylase n=1 Tax=Tepidiforma sp. TaxID=2682230 RepID=UPI002608262F|nr:A/G-specific adenine glycosylase [Tepidiforma sp.]MCX7618085.1 A/G-specific adenine glycosylase [Tepidiforma sp.]
MTATSATPEAEPAAIRSALAGWYAARGRHTLPWRRTRDPYAVLVSEIMLQQTQVERVLPYYAAWLERWPSHAALAAAAPADVITAWRGLGYNRRALALHAAARRVVEVHGGEFPWEPSALRALPGVGPYTAAALRCFVRDEPVPVLDTNIARVVARLAAGIALPRDLSPRQLEAAAAALLPDAGARDHNLALMDLGALVCTARNPACGACPLAAGCRWRRDGQPPPRAAAKRLAPRFEQTARYARGRIIDRLRSGPAAEDELRAMLPAGHRPRLAGYLAALERDGLAVPIGSGAWALPPG